MRSSLVAAALVVAGATGVGAQAQKVDVPGIRNFTKVDAIFACGGEVDPAHGMAEIGKLGYKSVVNLREDSESGAQIAASARAADAAGVKFYHVPFDADHPSAAAVDEFLRLVADPANQPMFIYCSSGNRAATMWLVKRMLVDKWPAGRATAEAITIGLASPSLKQFALDYVASHGG